MEGRETKAKQALGVISLLRHKSVPAGRAARISRDSAESIALGSASPAASLAAATGHPGFRIPQMWRGNQDRIHTGFLRFGTKNSSLIIFLYYLHAELTL